MKIAVYGTGACASCKILYSRVKDIVEKQGIEAELLYVSDIKVAIEKGLMQFPALEIDGKMVCVGKVAKEKEILAYLGG